MTKQNQLPNQNEPAVTVLLASVLNPDEVAVDFSDGTTLIFSVKELRNLGSERLAPWGDTDDESK